MLTLSFGAEGNSEEKRKLQRLFKAYNQMMLYAADRILNDKDDAEDAVQQAFLRVMNHLDDIDENDEQKTKSYLSIIAQNIAIDIYRKKKREWVHNISYDEYEIFIEDPSGQDFEEWDGVLGSRLEEAIAKLPAQYAEVIPKVVTEETIEKARKKAEKMMKKALKESRKKGELSELQSTLLDLQELSPANNKIKLLTRSE